MTPIASTFIVQTPPNKTWADPWVYHFVECLLCGTVHDQFYIRIKPDTASPRVLSIDGGGTRGRAPLEFLLMLQNSIGLPYPVQMHFDIVFGTSSGALTACALYINNWPIEKCIDDFERSSRLAFKERRILSFLHPLLERMPSAAGIVQFAISLLVDSVYSADSIERVHREIYGPSRSIVNSQATAELGAALGVTLTSVDDVNTFIVTNYNGIGERRIDDGYKILKFENAISDVPLWEILRCCTAAPYYFTPYFIEGAGAFQDGGLTFNNPASIALKESVALFPSTPEPSIVVSLGTGSTSAKQTPSEDLPALWQNSFPVRIFRAFWKQGDADEAWRHLIAPRELESKDKFFRFDVNFNQRPPSLDDVDRMSEVARMAREAVLGSSAIENLARRIRAELFVFEPSCSFSSSIALTYQNFVAAIFNVSDSSSAVCVLGQMS